jgi:hypothetical protein
MRDRIILRAAVGEGTNAITAALGTKPATVSRRHTRFATLRLAVPVGWSTSGKAADVTER